MQLEDQLTIRTAEGVDLQLTLAGLGSRIAAGLLDALIQAVLVVFIILLAVVLPGALSDVGFALVALVAFLMLFGYPILFEVLNSGRTPGKAAAGLRVLGIDGGPVGFAASAIRNVLRVVDSLPLGYVVGILAVLISEKNQRVGDMAAGTVVIREPKRKQPSVASPPLPISAGAVDSSRLTFEDLALLRHFVERSPNLPAGHRQLLAAQIAERVRGRVGISDPPADNEEFIRTVLASRI